MKTITPFVAALIWSVAGCGATVHSSTTPGANLADYRTFSFTGPPRKRTWPENAIEEQVRSSITRDLEQKGLVPATNGRPDLLVAYHMSKEEMQSFAPLVDHYPPDTFERRSLKVDFVDSRTRTVVWHGSATRVQQFASGNLAKCDKAVAKLINQYPGQLATVPRQTM